MFIPTNLLTTVLNATSSLITLHIPPSQPSLSQHLDPYLAGFSLELESWPDWAGALGKPNSYIQQLLSNLEERTGVPSPIRVGGSSLDAAGLDYKVQYVDAVFPPPRNTTPYPGASYVSIGKDFYALSANFASGTKFTWGVPLKSFQLNETVAQASRLSELFYGNRSSLLSGQELEYLEIGNEANYWGLPSWWNPKNYTSTFNAYGEAMAAVLPFAQGKTELLAGSFTGNAGMYPWSAMGVMGQGMFSDPQMGDLIGGWSQHKYYGQYDGQAAKPGGLMSKQGVRGNMASLFMDVQAVRTAGKKYVLSVPKAEQQGETNTYSNHGLPGSSNTAEAVIFSVDQMLYGATIGITRQYFHNGVGYAYSALCPSGAVNDGYGLNRPHIGALYHAFLVVNEAIGKTGSSHIAELATSDNRVAAYGVYEGGWLARAVLVNSEAYTEGMHGGRKNATVVLNNLASKQGMIKLFETPYTNSSRGMTWGGQSFDTADGKPEGQVKDVQWDGAPVVLPATSIAIVSFW